MATKKTAGLSADAVVSSILTDDMFATPDTVIEHPVKLGDGKERTMYFKPLTAIEWKKHMEAENSKDAKVRSESAARLISKCVVEPDGRRALTPQQAARLKPSVSGAFFMAILEINEIFKKPDLDDDVDDEEIVDEEDATDEIELEG
ncbi:hypothetical protein H0A65_10900 [Alcaligenaceae bacterium]|nr:hypothetical protein [Alcaligenaceae bacterium]